MKRTTLAIAALAVLSFSSCIGPNRAMSSLMSWNSRVTDSKWGNAAIGAGLFIIPVYQIAWLSDYLIFNSIEFWSGENPINEPEPFRKQAELE